jgi:hypothetical protein
MSKNQKSAAAERMANGALRKKASLEEICLPFASRYEADLYLGPGEISDTLIHQIARDAVADGRPLVLFTLTDCDPSGWQMFISIARKLQALQDLLFPQLRWEIVPVVLSPEQVRQLDLPEEPIKEGDRRAAAWERAFGVKQTEVDSLTTPEMTERGVLRQMLEAAIAPYIDATLKRRVELAEKRWHRAAGTAIGGQLDDAVMQRVRRDVAQLRDEIERIEDELAAATEHVELPPVDVPQSSIGLDDLDDGRQAVIRFATDWVAATKILISRKKYLDDDEA